MNNFYNFISQITDNIYISSIDEASNINILRKHNITYVLNCSDLSNNVAKYTNIKYLFLNLIDQPEYSNLLIKKLPCAHEFIDDAIKNNAKIVVHCQAGVSRSVSVVIAYLAKTYNWDIGEAFLYVSKYRSIADPNLGFYEALIKWKKNLDNEKIYAK